MKIIAHRGASEEAPENSIEAVCKAIEIGVDAIEIDCMLTKDRIPVVTHDDNLLISKKARGFIHQKNWSEIQKFNIPSLTQILEIVKNTPIELILDIKKQPGFEEAAPFIIAGLAQEILPTDQVRASSFSLKHLHILKKHFPLLRRGFILKKLSFKLVPIFLFDKFLQFQSVHPCFKGLKAKQIKQCQKLGFAVYPWVVNSELDLIQCLQWGVDGIFTDNPRLAKQILKGEKADHGG